MSFQDELNKRARTKEEVADQQKQDDMQRGREDAELDYYEIKRELLDMAEDGKYQLADGRKKITLYFLSRRIKYDFRQVVQEIYVNKSFFNRSGQHAHQLWFTLCNSAHFEAYMERLQALAKPDGIRVSAVGYYDLFNRQLEVYEFSLPDGSLIMPLNPDTYTTVRIKCEVEY